LAAFRLELGRSHVVVVVVVLVIGLVAAAVVYGVGRPRVVPVGVEMEVAGTPVAATGDDVNGAVTPGGADHYDEHEHGPGEVADDAGGPPGSPADGAGELVVHVAGKVAHPGVVSLPVGSRVVDAIDAAGGADSGVDMTPLNLARVLSDGEQVLVGVDPPTEHEVQSEAGDTGGEPAGGLVSLNTATVQQLETLPGIGPALAQRIVDWRERHGRFSSIDELHEVSGIGPSKYADIAPLVVL
jgi:competence protein ComEA